MPFTRWILTRSMGLLAVLLLTVGIVATGGRAWVETGPLLTVEFNNDIHLLDTGRVLSYRVAKNAAQPVWINDGDTLQFIGVQNAGLGCDICDYSMATRQITPGREASQIDFELPLGTWRVILSPDGRYLSYVRNDLNYLHDMQEGRVFPLPSVGDVGLAMDWSPDGRYLLFYDEWQETFSLIDTPSRDNLRQFNDLSVSSQPIWSPDGERLAFIVGNGYYPGSDIYLTRSNADLSAEEDVIQLTDWGVSYASGGMRWSPDGDAVLYIRARFNDANTFIGAELRIVVVDPNLGDVLDDRLLMQGGHDVRWSSDGEWVLFTRDLDLYRVRRDGTDIQRLTFTPDTTEAGFWRPR